MAEVIRLPIDSVGGVTFWFARVSQAGVAAPTVAAQGRNTTGQNPVFNYIGVGKYNLVFPAAIASAAADISVFISGADQQPLIFGARTSNTTTIVFSAIDSITGALIDVFTNLQIGIIAFNYPEG